MSSALGILRWPPDVFWKATVYEYTAAMRGYFAAVGIVGNCAADLSESRSICSRSSLMCLHELQPPQKRCSLDAQAQGE